MWNRKHTHADRPGVSQGVNSYQLQCRQTDWRSMKTSWLVLIDGVGMWWIDETDAGRYRCGRGGFFSQLFMSFFIFLLSWTLVCKKEMRAQRGKVSLRRILHHHLGSLLEILQWPCLSSSYCYQDHITGLSDFWKLFWEWTLCKYPFMCFRSTLLWTR